MKKYTFFFFFLQFSINCFSQTAEQLKMTIESFKCINKSWDGFVEFDGHGNEVSVAYSYRIYNPSNTGAARRGADGTVIYGSNINGMTRAGTETPDLGGITNGDVVPVYKTLMNEHINADDYIIIAPSVWEWDGPEKNTINNFNAQLENDLNWVITQPYPFLNSPVNYSDPFNGRVIKIFDKYSYGPALKYQQVFKNCFCPLNAQGNKVIGISAGTFNNQCTIAYPPTLLVLDTKVLYGLYINNYTATHPNPGTSNAAKESRTNFIDGVTIPFKEDSYAIETSNGSYSVFLRVEFTPDIQAPPPPSAPKYNKEPIINKYPIQPVNPINVNIIGKWAGTYGNTKNNNTSFYSFQLQANGSMQLINENAGIIANGTYSYINNVISGNYKYASGLEFSITGTMQNNKLSGTWGSNKNVSSGGKWVVNKK